METAKRKPPVGSIFLWQYAAFRLLILFGYLSGDYDRYPIPGYNAALGIFVEILLLAASISLGVVSLRNMRKPFLLIPFGVFLVAALFLFTKRTAPAPFLSGLLFGAAHGPQRPRRGLTHIPSPFT